MVGEGSSSVGVAEEEGGDEGEGRGGEDEEEDEGEEEEDGEEAEEVGATTRSLFSPFFRAPSPAVPTGFGMAAFVSIMFTSPPLRVLKLII